MDTSIISGGGGGGSNAPSGITVIQSITADGTQGSYDFTAIPQTFAALRLVVAGRGEGALASDDMIVQLNGGDDPVYDWFITWEQAGTPLASESLGNSIGYVGSLVAKTAGTTPQAMSSIVVDIPNYSSSALEKVLRCLSDQINGNAGGTGYVAQIVNYWHSLEAITDINFSGSGAAHLGAGTTLTLFGIG